MSEDGLHVETLDIVRAPGFTARGFQVDDLSEGINVVYGPNASGKTTMALSIQELLWPGAVRDGTELVGHLSLNGDDWRVETRDGRVTYQRNGQDANGPGLPPAEERDQYHLCLHDLLSDETRNESFAATIERESAGGYDLSAAAERLEFDDTPNSRRIGEVSAAESAVDAWRTARSEMDALRNEEQRLGRLRTELAEARSATDRVKLLDQVIEFAEARTELETAQEAVSAFPELLESIDGDEAEAVDELREEVGEWEDEKEAAEEAVVEATDAIETAALPDDGVPDGLVERLKSLASKLEDLERDRDDSTADLDEKRAERANCLEAIPLDVSEETLESLDPASWGAVSEFVRDAEQLRSDRSQYESAQQWLRERETPAQDLASLRNGQQALENWLKTSSNESAGSGSHPLVIGTISALLFGVAGVTLGFFVHPALYLFVAAGVGLGVYGYSAHHSGTDETEPGAAHREAFADLGLEPPKSWGPDAVRHRLTELNREIAAHELERLVEERRDAIEGDLEQLERLEDELNERRSELRERFGIDIDVSDLELLVFANGILRWQKYNDRVVGLENKIAEIDAQIDETRADLEATLEPYGYETVDDAAHARAHIASIESRATRHTDATRDLESAAKTIEKATEKIDTLETKEADLFAEIGLDTDELDRLRKLCDQADECQEAVETVRQKKSIVDREAGKLESYPGFDSDLQTKPIPELERDRRRAEETAASYDAIHEEITTIETRVQEAKTDSEVEDAITEKHRALDSLHEKLNEDCASLVGDALTEHVRETTGETNRPAVFEHARTVLARITHGRYRLDLDDGDGTFRAFDTVTETGFDLDELSSATRLQVLLAVRIAFVEQQEQGEQLPLILDETLANTDDGKAEVIIESMLELAKDGRQVWYFTAQGDEVHKWRGALEDVEDVDYCEIDLATVRGLSEEFHVPDLGDLEVRAVAPPSPDPDGHDHDSYGDALDVESFNPRLGAGSAHLWYVVDDVTLLSQLLEQGITRWGQLQTLLQQVDRAALVDEPDRLRVVERNGTALETFVHSWETGRGDRVDRQTLEDSGAVSSTFIDRVADLAEECNGEGERIIDGLRNGEVNRFHSDKTTELETYLEENGYIETVEPLEPEAIRLRVVNAYVENGLDREAANDEADALLSRLKTV
ncbi:ATP-binding protein [Natronosalvus vescus]|uniref:ATP-binding protein n=1 Tax=Natronosalvus vescus TaxID=2953881 RepID=UPI002091C3AC|nr:SMC family ATPase [Natronosalvus vescus]